MSRVPSKITQHKCHIVVFVSHSPFISIIAHSTYLVYCFFTRDWGSPLGKEFTNVGEGFCFSDAVQRSHSPINIDHNNHKKSSSLLHQKSSSQSGGQGRNNGRGGGEGPDGGLERSGGGANGNKGGPSMLGMGRHHSGEEGGAHPHRPSSSSSSNHHMNMGHASNTSNSRQHHGSGLHVHTTGTELEPSSPRRGGPQSSSSSSSSGSRGMNRGGTVGESDMMVSATCHPDSYLSLPPSNPLVLISALAHHSLIPTYLYYTTIHNTASDLLSY